MLTCHYSILNKIPLYYTLSCFSCLYVLMFLNTYKLLWYWFWLCKTTQNLIFLDILPFHLYSFFKPYMYSAETTILQIPIPIWSVKYYDKVLWLFVNLQHMYIQPMRDLGALTLRRKCSRLCATLRQIPLHGSLTAPIMVAVVLL